MDMPSLWCDFFASYFDRPNTDRGKENEKKQLNEKVQHNNTKNKKNPTKTKNIGFASMIWLELPASKMKTMRKLYWNFVNRRFSI